MLNLLIVDDEETIRIGLTKAVDWKEIGYNVVDTAANGIKALEIIKTGEIDVVLTDIRMPKMSGLELAAAISEGYPEIKVIILSGYSDFHYAQQAIQNNVFDYILKPSKEAEIIKVFTRLKDVIEKEKKNKKLIDESLAETVQNLLLKIVADSGKIDDETVTSLTRLFPGIDTQPKVLLTLELSMNIPCREDYRNVELKFYNFRIREIINDYDKGDIPVFSINSSQITLIVFSTGAGSLMKKAEDIFSYIRSRLDEVGEKAGVVSITGGLSTDYYDMLETNKQFLQSVTALKHMVYMGKDKLIVYDNDKSVNYGIHDTQHNEVSSKIIHHLYNKEFDKAAALTEQVFESFKQSRVCSREMIFISCYNLLYNINEGLRNFGLSGEKIVGQTDMHLNNIKELDTIDEIDIYFKDIIYRCARNMQEHEIDSIRKIIESAVAFIKDNYNKDINLEILSKRFNISHTYFCRLFKKELGVNFKDYLIELRLEKAKELLHKSEMKVYEISDAIGYDDQRYFSELFKCKIGMTPLEYREKVGR